MKLKLFYNGEKSIDCDIYLDFIKEITIDVIGCSERMTIYYQDSKFGIKDKTVIPEMDLWGHWNNSYVLYNKEKGIDNIEKFIERKSPIYINGMFLDYTIAIDFDGTLCKNMYPEIGEPNLKLIESLKNYKKYGHTLILWTCRDGKLLENALNFCKHYGLEFDYVNENAQLRIETFGNNTRKVGADLYIDDKAILPEDFIAHYTEEY